MATNLFDDESYERITSSPLLQVFAQFNPNNMSFSDVTKTSQEVFAALAEGYTVVLIATNEDKPSDKLFAYLVNCQMSSAIYMCNTTKYSKGYTLLQHEGNTITRKNDIQQATFTPESGVTVTDESLDRQGNVCVMSMTLAGNFVAGENNLGAYDVYHPTQALLGGACAIRTANSDVHFDATATFMISTEGIVTVYSDVPFRVVQINASYITE